MSAKLVLRISDDLWEGFKKTVSREVSLNDAVVELIQKEVERHGRY